MVCTASHVATCEFLPCSHSWVAVHPEPKGIIQFIGGALFGTFPTVAYRHFLNSLFEAGYTVVALPFRFTLRHWDIALDLLDEHYAVRVAMVETAIAQGYDPSIYLDAKNYVWIGHSLGCKYVALLELLSTPKHTLASYFEALAHHEPTLCKQQQKIEQGLDNLSQRLRLFENQLQRLTGQRIDYGRPSINHEISLLLAPSITDLDGAIPLKSLNFVFSPFIQVYPTVEQTHQLIEHSQLFTLTGLIQFARDRIATSTCQKLMQEQPRIRRRLLKGNHLEPVGIQMGPLVVDFNPMDKLIQPIKQRDLESQTLALLQRLQKKRLPAHHQLEIPRHHSIAA